MKTIITVLLVLFIIPRVSAQKIMEIVVEEVTLPKFWETWQDKVPVSGNVRVGLMIDIGNQGFDPKHFFVNIPKHEFSNLCAELSSKDGRYSAKLPIPIDTTYYGIIMLKLPTKYEKELSEFKTDEIVVLASLSNDCSKKPGAYVVSSWVDTKVAETDSVTVYINSISQTSLQLTNGDIKVGESKCSTLDFPIVAYNKKCTLPLNVLKDKYTLVIKQRIRRGSNVSFSRYKLFLRYAKN